MSRATVNILLLVLLLGAAVLTWGVRRDFTLRNDQFLPGMVRDAAYPAQSANDNFPDGKTLREPPRGSVARDYPPLHFNPSAEDAVRAGKDLHGPPADSSGADAARGAALFSTFCRPCHGAGAAGDGVIAARGFPPPPSLHAARALSLPDGQLFHIITHGQGNMPSLEAQISRSDRWHIVRYIRRLQQEPIAESAP